MVTKQTLIESYIKTGLATAACVGSLAFLIAGSKSSDRYWSAIASTVIGGSTIYLSKELERNNLRRIEVIAAEDSLRGQNTYNKIEEVVTVSELERQKHFAKLKAEADRARLEEVGAPMLQLASDLSAASGGEYTSAEIAMILQGADFSDIMSYRASREVAHEDASIQAMLIEAQAKANASATIAQAQSINMMNQQNQQMYQSNNDGGNANQSGFDKWHKYREIGESIIRAMIVSDKSVLIASGTGTGKTTTEQYFLSKFTEKYPNVTVYALLNKNDRLNGVPLERTFIFRPEKFEDYDIGNKEGQDKLKDVLKDIMPPLYTVYNEFLKRKELPPEERKRLKESSPIRLLLGDWFGTFTVLSAKLASKDLKDFISILAQIITIGRDMGIGLIVDTQSATLDSLGVAGNASIRMSLDMFSQGFIYYEDGEEKGETQTIRLMFKNDSICSAEDREEIQKAYSELCDGIKAGELKSPIIFTSVGSKPRIGIVPSL